MLTSRDFDELAYILKLYIDSVALFDRGGMLHCTKGNTEKTTLQVASLFKNGMDRTRTATELFKNFLERKGSTGSTVIICPGGIPEDNQQPTAAETQVTRK
jgi:hypothetical protein